jgi:hypothetical protein
MPLRDTTVDVFPIGPDQLPSDRQGGVGRLTDLRNCVFEHFDPANPSKPQYLNLKQRNGFHSRPTTGHAAGSGATETLSWLGPKLLGTVENGAPMSIVAGVPRVDDGTDWANYATSRVLTNKTTARPVYSAQSVAQAPDKSWLGGVHCRVWTEVTQGSNLSSTSITNVVAGFRSESGAWVRKPFVVQAGGAAGNRTMARVTNDGTQFWIFATDHNGGNPRINIFVYDTDGKQLATNHVDMVWDYEPGYWDIQYKGGTDTVLLAQPADDDPDADDHVQFSACSYDSGTITIDTNTDTNIHCNGPVAWATNFQDSENYLITTNFGEGDTVRLWAYKISLSTGNYVSVHEYDFGVSIPVTPDTLIGFSEPSTDNNVVHKNMVVSFGVPAVATTYGAAFDPALRYIKSYRCKWDNTTTFLRQTNSVCQVSRALAVSGDYYAWTYYQSGGGFQLPSSENVTLTSGDYFIGSPEQELDITGGGTYGATGIPRPLSQIPIWLAMSTKNIDGGGTADKVEQVTTPVAGVINVPDGTTILKWTFKNALFPANNGGAIMKLSAGASIGANTTWDVYHYTGSTIAYTPTVSRQNATITPGNFTTSGTVEIIGTVFYAFPDFDTMVPTDVEDLFENGTVTVSGAANSGNNGTFDVIRISYDPNPYSTGDIGGVWATLTSQVNESPTVATAAVSPAQPSVWFFSGAGSFSDADEFSSLRVTDDTVAVNNGTFDVVDVPSSTSLEVDATQSGTNVAQHLTPPFPSIELVLQLGVTPYTFYIQSVTFDYSYQNAIISVSSATHSSVNGLYKITGIVDSHTVHTVPVTSTSGNVRSESLDTGVQVVAILKAAAVGVQIQPQWFLTPLAEITTAQVGNLELGLAYADWRREAAATTLGNQNPYLLHVSTPCIRSDLSNTTDLPFRAVTVTEQSATAIGGNVSTSAIDAAVIGIKQFDISFATHGLMNGQLIPGPMAATYDGGNFVEAGILVGLEQPSLYSEQEASNSALTKNGTYSYVACLEAIDSKGKRIWTAPSPPLEVTLTGDNDSITIVGRLPVPLGSDGTNLNYTSHFGLSNRPMVVLSIYRTCIQNGLQTTAHYKITDDLAPNATEPISTSNDSGFTFPDEFTWLYQDENQDSVVASAEKLYTDAGSLPRFHPPAFHNGATGWQERDWLNAYDGAIWFSGQISEGEADWYTPLFRVPAPFEPTALGNLESFLAGFALDSKWYLPAFRPPLNNGQLSNIPAWQRLPLEGGCTGIVQPVRGGVAYSSNFGGVWYLSRNLQDEWTSQDYIDTLTGKTITAMAVDSKQRLHVLTNSTDWFVYDQIAKRWSRWILPATVFAKYATVSNGVVYFQDNQCVGFYDTSLFHDTITGDDFGTPLGFTMASLNFANVTGCKRLRQLQLRGKYKDTHNLAVSISYPDQNPNAVTTTMQLYTPDPTKPYVIDLYPAVEESSSYGLVVDADFTGIEVPGDSFELDVIGALVAVDSRSGINRSTQQISNG